MIIVLTAVNWRNQAALFSALLITFISINGRWIGQCRKGLKKKGFRFYVEAFEVYFLNAVRCLAISNLWSFSKLSR